MLSTYEALYDHGHLTWLGETPRSFQGRVIVTFMEDSSSVRDPLPSLPPSTQDEEIKSFMQEMYGAWGQRSYEETKALIAQRRVEDWGIEAG
ncbi:MAG: hypothetical protein HQL91_03090 [Magnetococcales bacterium]|nr:hypothetical protein [Magnetococcales bacterium]